MPTGRETSLGKNNKAKASVVAEIIGRETQLHCYVQRGLFILTEYVLSTMFYL
jgi:hypothetical protein